MKQFIILALVLWPTTSLAEQLDPWKMMFGFGEAEAARSPGWVLITSAGLAWPDGRQAVVTHWKTPDIGYVRCTSTYDSRMSWTGGFCYRSNRRAN